MLNQTFAGLCFAVPNARRMPGVRNIHIVRQIIIERDCLATMVSDLTSGSSEFFLIQSGHIFKFLSVIIILNIPCVYYFPFLQNF